MDDNIDPSMRKVKAAVDGMHGKMMSRVKKRYARLAGGVAD